MKLCSFEIFDCFGLWSIISLNSIIYIPLSYNYEYTFSGILFANIRSVVTSSIYISYYCESVSRLLLSMTIGLQLISETSIFKVAIFPPPFVLLSSTTFISMYLSWESISSSSGLVYLFSIDCIWYIHPGIVPVCQILLWCLKLISFEGKFTHGWYQEALLIVTTIKGVIGLYDLIDYICIQHVVSCEMLHCCLSDGCYNFFHDSVELADSD